jgi:glycosyltransferase involved in cell wall biosynthesis
MIPGNSKPLVVIADFSCSRAYTHHLSYIRAYAQFIKNLGIEVQVWVNRSADKTVLEQLNQFNVLPVLDSPDYGYEFKANPLMYALNRIVSCFVKMSSTYFTDKFVESIRQKVARLYFHRANREIENLLSKNIKTILIFPSVDGIGLRFLSSCVAKKYSIHSYVARTLNIESRGVLGISDPMAKYLEILRKDNIYNFYIGYETDIIRFDLSVYISESNLVWAPIPPRALQPANEVLAKKKNATLTLGFIGSARKNKGFDSIPQILDGLRNSKIDFKAIIQLANFEWDEYPVTFELLSEYKSQIKFLDGGCSENQILDALNQIDFLVMPYSVESYKKSGSGILFQAADLGIPILATDGVGFDWDLKKYSIGITFKTFVELINTLKTLENYPQDFEKVLKYYNREREIATKNLLELIL